MKQYKWCQTAKGPYINPHLPWGSIVAKNPMDLLCIDFMNLDLGKDGKETVLVITDVFSKFGMAVIMPNQKAKNGSQGPAR